MMVRGSLKFPSPFAGEGSGRVRGLAPRLKSSRCGDLPLTFPLLRNGPLPLPQGASSPARGEGRRSRRRGMTAQGPLVGLKVVELAHIMAGPVCGLMLADMGASVIKVEKNPGGDDSRRFLPPAIGGESAAFMMMNRT